jgi:hypothetical protein
MSTNNKRSSSLSQRIQSGKGIDEGLLDIPHPVILRHRTPSELQKEFEDQWGRRLKGVILPVTAPDGLLFHVEDAGQPFSRYANSLDKFKGWKQSVKDFSEMGLDIYLSVDPTMNFVETDALHTVDITGSGSQQVCFGNEKGRELVAAIMMAGVDEALEVIDYKKSKLAGVIIDAVDLFPMGSGNQGRLHLTCFCESCTAHFNEEDRKSKITSKNLGLLNKFRTFPNPWNLALKDSGTGIAFASNISPEATASQVVGLCRQKAFDEIFKADKDKEPVMLQYAEDLLKYIEVRHKQVIGGLNDVFDQVLDFKDCQSPSQPIKRIVIIEGEHYGWTSGIQFGRLDGTKNKPGGLCPVDEIWFNPTSSEMKTSHLEFRSYLWRRSRYFIDAFFSTVANASDPNKRSNTGISRLSEPEVRELLRDRLATVIAASESSASLASLPDLKFGEDGEELSDGGQRIGFVGVALTRDIGEELIRTIIIPPGKANQPNVNNDMMAEFMRQWFARNNVENSD